MSYAMPYQQTEEGCRIEGVHRWELEAAGVRIGLQVSQPRSVPWLRVVRVPRFGRGLDPLAVHEIVEALRRFVKNKPVLRLHVEVWSEQTCERALAAAACQAQGFLGTRPRSYRDTVWMDISGPEAEILRSSHRSVRRNIQTPHKKGLAVVPVTERAAIPRIKDIFTSTFARTGGTPPFVDWDLVVGANARPGCRHHLAGLLPAQSAGQHEMLAFAVAFLHGDVAELAHAGSLRDPRIKLPLLYAPTWELLVWARSRGARFWDFGGISPGLGNGEDPLAGTNRFKRFFSDNIRQVGEEWVLEPRQLAGAFSRMMARLR